MELLFERFLSEERGEWPTSTGPASGDQRERVIQHVYARYGERGAAMTANVITYRDRSASREIGKVLGIRSRRSIARAPDAGASSGRIRRTRWSALERAGLEQDDRASALRAPLRGDPGLPRHLGQHSAGW